MTEDHESRHHLRDLLEDFDAAMLVTRTGDKRMRARPMAVAKLEADADAYFVTAIDSPKVAEIETHPEVTLTFQGSGKFAWISGRARVVRDSALIDALWNEAWKVWFPKGKSDPALTLLEIDAQDGEYWDNTGAQAVKYGYEALMAYAKGRRPDERAAS